MNERNKLLGEAYGCGEIAASAFQTNMTVWSMHRIHRADDARARAEELADILGPEALEAFNDGFSAILPAYGEPVPF